MANEFIEVVSSESYKEIQRLLKTLEGVNAELVKAVGTANEFNAALKKTSTPSGSANVSKTATKSISDNNKLLKEQERLTQRLIDLKKKEAIENAKLKVQISTLNKEQKKQAQSALGMLNAYQKLDAELNQLRLDAQGLAAQMFNLEEAGKQNTVEYSKLANQYDKVSQRVKLLDTGLKNIDQRLGKSQRNVGNYASGFNGLNNSINQVTREFPAFTYSFQTGILALSNNIPILADEIQKLNLQNKALAAQGKPVQSAFVQIRKALFSWQTAMSAGIAVATIFADKIADFAEALFTANTELKEINKRQEDFNNAQLTGVKNAQSEIIELEKYLAVVKDRNISDEERNIALQKLRSQYSFYFKDLTDEQILLGQSEEANLKVIEALEKRKEIEEKTEIGVKNRQALLDLNVKEESSLKRIAELEKDIAFFEGKRGSKEGREFLLNLQQAQRIELERLTETNEAQNEILQKQIANETDIFNLKKEIIGLEYEQNDIIDERSTKTIEYADYLASEFALIQQRLENEAKGAELIANNEEKTFEKRQQAAERFYKIQIELAERAHVEEQRLLKNALNAEVKTLNEQVKNAEISEKDKNNAVFALQKQFQFDSALAYTNYAESIREANRGLEQSLKGVWDQINFNKAQELISKRNLEQTKEYAEVLQKIGKNTDYKKFEEAKKDFAEANKEITKANIQAEIDYTEAQLMALDNTEANVQARIELQKQLQDQQKKLTDVTVQELTEQRIAWEKLQKATESYLETFTSGFLADTGLSSLQTFFDGTFDKLIEGANTFGEKFAVTFNAITEVAQEAFAFINQNQQAYFDAQRQQIQADKEVAESFAVTTEAKEEIQRQFEERQREIRIQEAKAEKENALFNIAINTAQGVTAALAQANIPLSIIIGALGLAQAQIVASRPLPAYADGTNFHKGGDAVVGDGGQSELVWQPSKGFSITPDVPTVMNLERGSKVFPEVPGVGMFGNLFPDVNINGGSGITEAQMSKVMAKTLGLMPVNVSTFDKRGFNTHVQNGHNKRMSFNNNVTQRGIRLGA